MSALLEPDPVLPRRDRLLDVEAVRRLLTARLGTGGVVGVSRCELIRADYRFGRRLRVLHRAWIGARWQWVCGRTFPEGRAEEAFRRAAAVATPRDGLRAVVHDGDIGAVFWTFPNDRKLVRLAAILGEARALARRMGGPRTALRIMGYKPEKSLVLEFLRPRGRAAAYAKIYNHRELAAGAGRLHAGLARQLAPDDPRLRLPAPLACVADGQMLVLEPIDGRRIADLEGEEAASALAHLGAALATLHSLVAPAEAPPFTRHQPACLAEAAGLLAEACPRVGREAEALAAELARRYEPSPEPPVCLHGDVHPKNGILVGNGAALIDLDKVAHGEPAVDLGSFLSLLRYECLLGRLSAADERSRGTALLAGYARGRSLPAPGVLRWHTAAALLAEQATRAVRQIRPAALARLDLLLADAGRILRGHLDG